MQVIICCELFPSGDQSERLDELMRIQSSCMRYSYNRLCEGRSKSEIEEDLKEKFPEINSRYRRDGYFRAKFNYDSSLKLVKAGELESPEKVVFGGRKTSRKERARKSQRGSGNDSGTTSSIHVARSSRTGI